MNFHKEFIAALLGCTLLTACNSDSPDTNSKGGEHGTYEQLQNEIGALAGSKNDLLARIAELESRPDAGSEENQRLIAELREELAEQKVSTKAKAAADLATIEGLVAGSKVETLSWRSFSATAMTKEAGAAQRTFMLATNQPGNKKATRTGASGGMLTVEERGGDPSVRTGSVMFDGLFALAMLDAHDLSVNAISDGAYNDGKPLECSPGGCYQTGREWTYVWTRDTAYAIDLGLAQIDPKRAMNSLLFKLSERRDAGRTGEANTEIVQDTGTGGSWPNSTDRVTWARGAWELLKYLDGTDRATFLDKAYAAIKNTIENDRYAVLDPRDGLYRGEMSFLDWREQTYPDWTANNVVHIAMSKALSTNVSFWKILDTAALMATELKLDADAKKYRGWADELKTAINSQLWLKDSGLYSTMKPTEFDQAPVHRFELLGEALAIIDGVADEAKAKSILAKYPHTDAGAAVVWPQVRDKAVYHNRAIWPFVSSYLIKAASGRNAEIVNQNFDTLMRGAALNLSNMENFNAENLNPDDPSFNSERQAWSVGGYIGTVMDVIYGRQATQDGIRFHPFITKAMRNGQFAKSDKLILQNLTYRGKVIDVEVQLPPKGLEKDGYYTVQDVSLNGATVPADRYFTPADLTEARNIIKVRVVNGNSNASSVTKAGDEIYGPSPVLGLKVVKDSTSVMLSWDASNAATDAGSVVNIYRNGTRVAENLVESTFIDADYKNDASQCYVAERQFSGGKLNNVSHRSEPFCIWPENGTTDISVSELDKVSNSKPPVITPAPEGFVASKTELKFDHGRQSLSDWGAPGEEITTKFTPVVDGTYAVQHIYGNANGPVDTGITATVKTVKIIDQTDNTTIADAVTVMPHLPNWDIWSPSSVVTAQLKKDREYRIVMSITTTCPISNPIPPIKTMVERRS